jgi:hypothetical protein
VPTLLALDLSSRLAQLGPLIPGVAQNYDTSLGATVTSTAGNATLSVADLGNGSGKLGNGTTELASPLLVRATNAASTGTAFAPLTANPVTLLSYASWFANDAVTITLRQPIAATEPLTAGGYAKTIVFTLSTATP